MSAQDVPLRSDLQNIDLRYQDFRFVHEREFFDRLDKTILFRPKVKILIVTDGSGAYDSASDFGLGLAISSILADPWWWVRFEITTAHRRNDPVYAVTATYKDFRFDVPPVALDTFDQIWLFGVEGRAGSGSPAPTPSQKLQPDEIAAINTYMSNGGGVFATGDHYGLGENMCAELPRISKMRRWEPGGPVGTPPEAIGEFRYDTCREGGTPGYQFVDQSDNTPQRIYPTHYYDPWNFSIFRRRWRPHPVLCGREGVIDMLPDHMHENRIVMPNQASVDANPTEWPGGLAHEVIATARVIPHTNTDGFGHVSGPPAEEGLSQGEFGVLGAYDGHRQNIGRIVTDATWHHWFNVNLRGFDPASAGYGKIRNYYWNVALWLSPQVKQSQLFHAAVYGLIRLDFIRELGSNVPPYFLGFSGIDAIGRRASQCVATDWLISHLPFELAKELFYVPKLPNPPDPPPYVTLNYVREYAMGGIIQEFLNAFGPESKDGGQRSPDYKELLALSKRGVRQGLEILLKEQEQEQDLRRKELSRLGDLVAAAAR